jgi:hypothetical protein
VPVAGGVAVVEAALEQRVLGVAAGPALAPRPFAVC